MIKQEKLLIDGKWVDAESGQTFQSINPANREVIAECAAAGAEDVDKAVKAARKALDEGPWGKMSASERGKILLKIAELIRERSETLALLDTLDMGKPITDARGDAEGAAIYFDYYAGFADKITGVINPVAGDFLNYSVREPVGVVGALTPWNFPIAMFALKVAPSLACGCAVVYKPSRWSPLSALEAARICQEAGLPDGVLNLITGDGVGAGEPLAGHPGVAHVTLTGSTSVGRRVAEVAAKNLTEVTLELGGKTANIVFPEAKWDCALNAAVRTIFLNQGQICTAGSRLVIHEDMHDEFLSQLVAKAEKLRVGDPLKEDTKMGSLASEEQFEKVTGYIEIGKQEGAKLIMGGHPPEDPELSKGYFMLPTVFDEVDNKMTIARDEIFGPVLSVITFKDEDEAAAIANDSDYGLAHCVWSTDVRRIHRMAQKLDAGIIWCNVTNIVVPSVPYAGFKDSGMGMESGQEVVEAFTKLKNVWVNLSDEPTDWPDT